VQRILALRLAKASSGRSGRATLKYMPNRDIGTPLTGERANRETRGHPWPGRRNSISIDVLNCRANLGACHARVAGSAPPIAGGV